jgi:mono/diheme cytochrome c family protein
MTTISKTVILLALASTGSWAADAKAGQPLYEKTCRSCHGLDGAPSAAVAKLMKVEMRDLRDPAVQALSNEALKKIILEGQGKMKPTPALTAQPLRAWLRT